MVACSGHGGFTMPDVVAEVEYTLETSPPSPHVEKFREQAHRFAVEWSTIRSCDLVQRSSSRAGTHSASLMETVECSLMERNKFSMSKAIPSSASSSHDCVKINTVNAFRESSMSGGWGFAVRNDRGEAVAAGQGHLQRSIVLFRLKL